MSKRTKKEFENYNDYHDRPFGLKWGTAFAIAELSALIVKTQSAALKDNKEYPLMSRFELDEVLQEAFLKSKQISIQVIERDEKGNLQDNIVGHFYGFSDEEYLYINEEGILWESIRNIALME